MRHGRRVGGATVIAALVGLCALAACSNLHGDPVDHPSTSTSSTSTFSTATSSTVPASSSTTTPTSAVLAAYRAGWTAYEHALSDANPEDPALTATMVDPLLQRTKADLLGYQQDGIVGRGSVDPHPKLASMTATTATVVDCIYSSSELVYAKTRKPVPPATSSENDGVQATLALVNGAWKVSQQTVTEGKCAAGS
jgi:hypothetical protein